METTNVNIHTEKIIKDQEEIFNELEIPNDTTVAAIEKDRKIINDPSSPSYSSIEALKKALDI